MTDNLPATATQQTSHGKSSPVDRISELTRTLTPVRPVGMNDEMASDWLAVVAAETAHLSDYDFRKGCENARRTCEHHSQIMREILKGDPELAAWQRKLDNLGKPLTSRPRPALEGPAAKLIADAAKGCRP